MGNTKEDLVRDLLECPQSEVRDRIIERARSGKYHDFESNASAPKLLLVRDLRLAGLKEIAKRVIAGAYDHEYPREGKE